MKCGTGLSLSRYSILCSFPYCYFKDEMAVCARNDAQAYHNDSYLVPARLRSRDALSAVLTLRMYANLNFLLPADHHRRRHWFTCQGNTKYCSPNAPELSVPMVGANSGNKKDARNQTNNSCCSKICESFQKVLCTRGCVLQGQAGK